MISDSQILDRIAEIIRKLAQGTATSGDHAELAVLQHIRVKRLTPKFNAKRS